MGRGWSMSGVRRESCSHAGSIETVAAPGRDEALVWPRTLPGGKAVLFVSAHGPAIDRHIIEVLAPATWSTSAGRRRVPSRSTTPAESAEALTQEHHVVFLQNVFDELRRKVPLGK